ncbi:MAG: accessory factor UbiK family protein [Proteobacteria bacterium]|nr:accessory factor UbiK family protein [Pseudomonadota bacterium]
MFSPNTAEDKVKQFVESLPPGFKTLNQEMKNQLKQALLQWFSSMDLVTREEFDIQCQVLIKTRLKLDELSAQLANLSVDQKS